MNGSFSDRPERDSERASSGSAAHGLWVRWLTDWLKTLSIAVTIVLLLHYFVFNLSTVEGQSMEPTLTDKEWLFISKFAYIIGRPALGDIVILQDPTDIAGRKELLVKRIVGMPGDTIEIRDSKLYRNGELAIEPYTDSKIEDMDYGPVVVANGSYFVMGDNRHARASRDSRTFGVVPLEKIKGRADFILWPIDKISSL